MTDAKRYSVQQFANIAGVTVRALHHYDRLGLLRPIRNAGGFRSYTQSDLERLEKIVALKFIGLPLRQIGNLLSGDVRNLGRALSSQLTALEEKKRRLEITINAVRQAEATLRSGGRPDLKQIIEVIEMQNDYGWILQHFTEDTRPRVRDRIASLTPDMRVELERDLTALVRDMEASLGDEAGGSNPQALLKRWEGLVRRMTGDDPELVHGLKSLYADRNNWPEPLRITIGPLLSDRLLEFVGRAVAARNP